VGRGSHSDVCGRIRQEIGQPVNLCEIWVLQDGDSLSGLRRNIPA